MRHHLAAEPIARRREQPVGLAEIAELAFEVGPPPRLGQAVQRPSLPAEVALGLEAGARLLEDGAGPAHPAGVALGSTEREHRERGEVAIARLVGEPPRPGRLLDRLGVLPHLDQDLRESHRGARHDEIVPGLVGGTERPPVQGRRRARLPAEHLLGAAGQVRRGDLGCRPRRVRIGTATGELPRAFVVDPDRRDRLAAPGCRAAEPPGDLDVPLRTDGLRDRVVRHVADQRVLPAVRGGAGHRRVGGRVEQVAGEQPVDARAHVLDVAERHEHLVPRDGAADGGVEQDLLLVGRQRIQPSGDQQPDRRGDLAQRAGVHHVPPAVGVADRAGLDQHAEHLLEEQRVPVRPRDGDGDRLARPVVTEHRGGEMAHRRTVEPRERGHRDAGDPLAREPQHEHRRRPRIAVQIGEQIAQRPIGPLQVVQHDRDGPLARQVLEHQARRSHGVTVAPDLVERLGAQERAQVRRERGPRPVADPPHGGLDRGGGRGAVRARLQSDRLRDRVADRRERRAVPERHAATDQEPLGGQRVAELDGEPALPDPRLPHHGEHA